MKLEEVAYLGVSGISRETQFLYKKIDSLLDGESFSPDTAFEDVVWLIHHMMNNRIADAVLYSRLSSRCISHSEDFEELRPEIDFQELGEEYLEHSKEEMMNYQSLMLLAQGIDIACSLDFTLKDSANAKFANPSHFIDFSQYREMMSIAEFYNLYRILLETDILDELDDETQYDIIEAIKSSLETEIQHFEEFFDLIDISGFEKFIELLSKVKNELDEGF